MIEFKRKQMEHLAQHRDELRKEPKLCWLFFELTTRCNLHCRHCGSNCSNTGEALSKQDVLKTLSDIRNKKPMICLTGGEPLMHPNFFDIANAVKNENLLWGMTTNATLIGKSEAHRLKEAGLSTVSVSLDGLPEEHDAFRQVKGAWKKAVEGIKHLQDVGYLPQVTTVFHSGNIDKLDEIYNMLCKLNITSWRPINVEPIGRACESKNMLLDPEAFQRLITFIHAKRFDPECRMTITYGCSHYLGLETERMVRNHYFLCGAGITGASIRSNGDICACLDIENRPELVQGNIHRDHFLDVWNTHFEAFRCDRTADSPVCSSCSERYICGGDSTHTWDFDHRRPLLCGRDYMTKPSPR